MNAFLSECSYYNNFFKIPIELWITSPHSLKTGSPFPCNAKYFWDNVVFVDCEFILYIISLFFYVIVIIISFIFATCPLLIKETGHGEKAVWSLGLEFKLPQTTVYTPLFLTENKLAL